MTDTTERGETLDAVEVVAKAICNASYGGASWEDVNDKGLWRDIARAAIAAYEGIAADPEPMAVALRREEWDDVCRVLATCRYSVLPDTLPLFASIREQLNAAIEAAAAAGHTIGGTAT